MDSRTTSHDGTVSKWDDERGFGYIMPTAGGREVFAHISAWPRSAGRPTVGDFATFDTERAPDGRTRAAWVRRPYEVTHRRKVSGVSRVIAYAVLGGFVALYALLSLLYRPVSPWIAMFYAAASLVTFLAYALDKSAARSGGWRTKESRLQAFALVGGWPGAIIAQQVLHHKNRKASFQAVFWVAVIVNIAVFLIVSSPRFIAVLTTLLESATAAHG